MGNDIVFSPLGTTIDTAEITDGAVTAVKMNGAGNFLAPIGSVQAWLKSLTGTPSLPSNWVECNGQTISDAASVYNGVTIPNLNASGGGTQRFLRGATASGITGGADMAATSTSAYDTVDGSGTAQVAPQHSHTVAILPSFYEVVWILRIK